jgi:hypothetical protein
MGRGSGSRNDVERMRKGRRRIKFRGKKGNMGREEGGKRGERKMGGKERERKKGDNTM